MPAGRPAAFLRIPLNGFRIMELFDAACALLQKNFQVILSVFWVSWWLAVVLCLILVTINRYISRRKMANLQHSQENPAANQNDRYHLSREQLRAMLQNRREELRTDIERMGLDFEARAVLENFSRIIEKKLADLDMTFEELNNKLLMVHRALDSFQGIFPPQQIKQAKQTLYRGETLRAEILFKQAVLLGKKLASEAADSKVIEAQGTSQAAEASYHLGVLAESRGDYILAAQYYHQAAELQPANLSYLSAAGTFAYSLWAYNEAEKLLKSTFNIQEKLLGPEHPEVAQTLNNLGALYHSQGRLSEAEALYTWALEIYKPSLNLKHPDMMTLVENYTTLLKDAGRHDEASAVKARLSVPGSTAPPAGTGIFYVHKGRA